jgi:hypothetical protein
MVQLSDTRFSCITILLVSLVSFATITLCVATRRVFIAVSVHSVIDSVRKILGTSSYIQDISRFLWNPQVHYRVHKSPPLAPALSQMRPVHTLPPYFPKTYTNIIFSSICSSSQWSLRLRIYKVTFHIQSEQLETLHWGQISENVVEGKEPWLVWTGDDENLTHSFINASVSTGTRAKKKTV